MTDGELLLEAYETAAVILAAEARRAASRPEGHPDFNWRRDGNARRGVITSDGRRRVVTGPQFDKLRHQGKLSPTTPRLRGDNDRTAPANPADADQRGTGQVRSHTRVDPRTGKTTTVRGFIRRGQSGGTVRAVQHRVGATPDGQFGNQTRRRVIAFQRKHGLQADGIVGKQTMSAMLGNRSAHRVATGAIKRDQMAQFRSGATSRKQRIPARARGGRTV